MDVDSGLDERIASRISELRTERGLSLEALSSKCGVSRSMISLIERGESSPTAVVLEKLTRALGVTLASLFDATVPAAASAPPLARRDEQPEWRDPASGYVRRNVTPPGSARGIRQWRERRARVSASLAARRQYERDGRQ
jgi:transcriptional regulator with XRE-family HTH domain